MAIVEVVNNVNWLLLQSGLVALSTFAFITNFVLVFVFTRRRNLRTLPNRFVLNLLVANIVTNLLLAPLLLTDGGPVNVSRQLFDICTSFVGALSILSILLIAANQYFGVVHSLHYHCYVTRWRYRCSLVAVWLLAAVIASCAGPPGPLYATAVICCPLVTISALYVRICVAAHQNSRRHMRHITEPMLHPHHHQQQQQSYLPKVYSAPNLSKLSAVNATTTTALDTHHGGSSNNLMIHHQRAYPPNTTRIAQLKQKWRIYRVQMVVAPLYNYYNGATGGSSSSRRTAKISVFTVVLLVCCHLPYGAIVVLLSAQLVAPSVAHHCSRLALFLLVASSALTPYLFAYRHKRVKREVRRLFGIVRTAAANNADDNNSSDNCRHYYSFLRCQRQRDTVPPMVSVTPQVTVVTTVTTTTTTTAATACDVHLTGTSSATVLDKCQYLFMPLPTDGCCLMNTTTVGGGEAGTLSSTLTLTTSSSDCSRGSFSSAASTQLTNSTDEII